MTSQFNPASGVELVTCPPGVFSDLLQFLGFKTLVPAMGNLHCIHNEQCKRMYAGRPPLYQRLSFCV